MNERLAGIPPSLIRELNRRKKPGDVDLGLGEPIVGPDPAPLCAALDWVLAHGCRYGPNPGLPELRAAISSHYRYPGLGAAENVCVTNGSQEAIFLAIKVLCEPSVDEILIVEPAYPLYRKVAAMEGITCRGVGMVATEDFAFDMERIVKALGPHTKLVVICSPCNPTGKIADQAAFERLAASLRNRPSPPWVLVDEVYRELYFTPQAPGILPREYERVLIAGSLSKSNALTGLRLGWLLAPTALMPELIKAHQFVLTSASIFSQRVALAIFEKALLGDHRETYRNRMEAFSKELLFNGLPFIRPEGSFYLMVRLPPAYSEDSMRASVKLVDEHGVLTIPGAAFGEMSEGWLRTSFVAEPAVLLEGARRLGRLIAP